MDCCAGACDSDSDCACAGPLAECDCCTFAAECTVGTDCAVFEARCGIKYHEDGTPVPVGPRHLELGRCVEWDECGHTEEDDEGQIIKLVCDDDHIPGTHVHRECEHDNDCLFNGDADTCGEAVLNGERVAGTERVCIEEALCTM